MKSPIRLFRDERGALRAAWPAAPAGGLMVLRYLEGDLAEDPQAVARVLREGRAILRGKSRRFQIGGNAFVLKLTPQRASLTPTYDEQAQPYGLPLVDFLKLIARWQKLIRA
ncbi:MAG TPA: hypothetical protein VFE24_10215 [Pirellulales bacterium]|jgi:hypothetical protein|nr:hypothetical protein [Pirellulales bacterium]